MTQPTLPPGRESAHAQTDVDVQGVVEQLWIYPIKSCAGIAVSHARLLPAGLEWDRHWMVVDEHGEFVSQREWPRMALVQPALRMGQLELKAPGMLTLRLALNAAEAPRRVRVWDDEVDAWDMGDVAARWFAAFLELGPGSPSSLRGLRVVRCEPEPAWPRLSSMAWTDGVAVPNRFSDGFPLLVAGSASLQHLNERLQAVGHAPVDVRRFRPNLVLGGLDVHDEDRVSGLHLLALEATGEQHHSSQALTWALQALPPRGQGDQGPVHRLEVALTKPCARCPIPNVDPDTGHSHPAVADALQAYRQDPRLEGAVTFGMNGFVRTPLPSDGVWLHVGQHFGAHWRFD